MTRIAIIGLGAATHYIHLPAYRECGERVKVVAGCDPDPTAKAKDAVPELFDDPRAMLEKIRPDVVAVCTPPWLHREHALLGLEHGCHVFCEKPFAENLEQADDVIAAAERAGRLVVINNQFPYLRIHRAAKEAIGSAEFGRLLYLHAWQTMEPTEFTEAGWRAGMQRRLCFEFGVHVFELVRYFFEDTPVRLQAHMPSAIGPVQGELVNVISMEFADGRAASMVLDRLNRGHERYLDVRLDGERATIQTSIGGRLQLRAGLETRERRPFVAFDYALGGRALLERGQRERTLARDGLMPFTSATAYHFGKFLDAIETGVPPPGNAKDNRDTLALVMAAYDAAESRRTVEMSAYGVSSSKPR
jgi:D-apiose dehydrogenase